MTPRVAVLLALAAIVAALAGGTGQAAPSSMSAQKPEVFMSKIVRLTVASRNAEVYALLHPAHQKLVPKSRFLQCRAEPAGQAPTRVVSSVFDGKRFERIDVPLIPQHTSTAVRLKLVVARGAVREPATVTVHAVWIGTRWAWYLPAGNIPAFKAGKCPT